MNNASFVGFGNLIFPVDRPIDGDTRLDDIDDIYIWYNYIDDDSRPIVITIQVEVTNHPKVLYSKGMVLSVREKPMIKLEGVC